MAHFAGSNGIVVFDGNESTEEELKKMLFCFRVHELQHLLGFANRSKLGKKNELIQRAIDLIRTTKSLQVQEKVRELYRKRLHQDSRYSTPDLQMIDPRDSYRQCTTSISPPVYPGHSSAYNSYNNVQTTSSSSHLIMNSKILDSLSGANVKLVNLPFYDVIIPLLKPTMLRTTNPNSKFQENYLPFTLNVQQLEDIQYVDTAPLPRTEVQLRFCLFDTTREQKDDFPTGVEVRINEKQVVLPNLIPTNKPGVEPKRPSRPVNITPYCRDSPTERMHIYWAGDNGKNWVVAIYLVRRINSNILLQRLKQKKYFPADNAKRMIRNYLSGDNDIATTSLRVSLSCPIGKMRMQLPCRLQQCQHLQCFDADLFLRMNEKKPTWMCPVCDKPTPFQDLLIDEFFTVVLKDAPHGINEVELLENGTWVPIKDEDEANDDDDDEAETSVVMHAQTKSVTAQPSAVVAKSATSPTVSPTSSTTNSSIGNKNVTTNQKSSAATANMTVGSASKATAPEILIDLTEDSDNDEPALVHSTSTVVSKPPLNSNLASAGRNENKTSCALETTVSLSDEIENSTFIRESQIDSAVPSNDSIILLTDSPPIPVRHSPRHSNVTTPDDPVDHNSCKTPIEVPKASSSSCANPAPSCASVSATSTNNASIAASQSVSDLLMAAFRNAEFGSATPAVIDAPHSAFMPQSSPMLSPTRSNKKRFKRLLPSKNDRSTTNNQTSFSPYVASSSSTAAINSTPLPCPINGPAGPSASATPIFDFSDYGDHYVQQIYNDVANYQNRFSNFSNNDASAAAQNSCDMAAAAACSYAQINPMGQPPVASAAYRVSEQHGRSQQSTGFWNRPAFNMSIPNSMAYPSTSYSNIFSTAPQISQYNVNGSSTINSMAKNHLQAQRSAPLPNYQQAAIPTATASGYMTVGFQQQSKNFDSSTSTNWRDFGGPGGNNFYNNTTDYRKYMNNNLRPDTSNPEPPGL